MDGGIWTLVMLWHNYQRQTLFAATYVNNENSERVYLAAETLASVINNCASQLPKESIGLFQLLSSVSLFT